MIRWADARGGADAGGRHLRGITQQKYDTVKELHSKSMVYSTPVVGERRGRPRGRRAAAGGAKRVGGRGGGGGWGGGGGRGGGHYTRARSMQTGQHKLVNTNWSLQTGQHKLVNAFVPPRENPDREDPDRIQSLGDSMRSERLNAIRAIKCDPSD